MAGKTIPYGVLGETVRLWLEALPLSTADVSRATRISKPRLHAFLNRIRDLRISELDALLNFTRHDLHLFKPGGDYDPASMRERMVRQERLLRQASAAAALYRDQRDELLRELRRREPGYTPSFLEALAVEGEKGGEGAAGDAPKGSAAA